MTRLFYGAAVCAAFLLSFAHLSLEWSDQFVEKNHYGERISLEAERERTSHLTEQFDELNERITAKDRIAERLLAGEMTLTEAAASFGRLYDRPLLREEIHRVYPECSKGESLCHRVIDWVEFKVRMDQSPDEAEVVRRRLESELQKHLAEHGAVELPE
jgi:hypothetical protein